MRCLNTNRQKGVTYLAVLGQIDLERLTVVLEPERAHGKEDVFTVDRFPLFLVALLGRYG